MPGEATRRRREAAYDEGVWSWHPLLMSSERRGVGPTGRRTSRQSADDGDKRNSSPGRARRKPLKPLRGECRVSGVPVVTTVCTLPRHTGCGCPAHPAFPCALTFQARKFLHPSGAPRRENAKVCDCSAVARIELSRNPGLTAPSAKLSPIARSLSSARIRATRWFNRATSQILS